MDWLQALRGKRRAAVETDQAMYRRLVNKTTLTANEVDELDALAERLGRNDETVEADAQAFADDRADAAIVVTLDAVAAELKSATEALSAHGTESRDLQAKHDALMRERAAEEDRLSWQQKQCQQAADDVCAAMTRHDERRAQHFALFGLNAPPMVRRAWVFSDGVTFHPGDARQHYEKIAGMTTAIAAQADELERRGEPVPEVLSTQLKYLRDEKKRAHEIAVKAVEATA